MLKNLENFYTPYKDDKKSLIIKGKKALISIKKLKASQLGENTRSQ